MLSAAESNGESEERVNVIKAKLKKATYCFSTYNANVTDAYLERADLAWIALKMGMVVTHRAAVTTEVLILLVRAAKTAQAFHDLESMFAEFRATVQAMTRLKFYSLQRWMATRPRLDAPPVPAEIQHFMRTVSDLSDTYLASILLHFNHSKVKYILQWFEQQLQL